MLAVVAVELDSPSPGSSTVELLLAFSVIVAFTAVLVVTVNVAASVDVVTLV